MSILQYASKNRIIAEKYFEKIGKSYSSRAACQKAFIQLKNEQVDKRALLEMLKEGYLTQKKIVEESLK